MISGRLILLLIILALLGVVCYQNINYSNQMIGETMINVSHNVLSHDKPLDAGNNAQNNSVQLIQPDVVFKLVDNNETNSSIDSSIEESSIAQTIKFESEPDLSVTFAESSDPIESDTCKWAEQSSSCSVKTCGLSDLHPILDPRFNMREVAKQCLLLEDHLNNKKKRCLDCIKKHFLIIDGLLEEAVSLEKDNSKRDFYRELYVEWVKIEKMYSVKSLDLNNIDDVSKLIRIFRKPLVEDYFDIVSEYD